MAGRAPACRGSGIGGGSQGATALHGFPTSQTFLSFRLSWWPQHPMPSRQHTLPKKLQSGSSLEPCHQIGTSCDVSPPPAEASSCNPRPTNAMTPVGPKRGVSRAVGGCFRVGGGADRSESGDGNSSEQGGGRPRKRKGRWGAATPQGKRPQSSVSPSTSRRGADPGGLASSPQSVAGGSILGTRP